MRDYFLMKLTQKILLTNLIILAILFILVITPRDSVGFTVFLLGMGSAAINLIIGILLLLLHVAMPFFQTPPKDYLPLVGAFLLSAAVAVLLAIPMCFLSLNFRP